MSMGAFSISLNVKDLSESKDFYEKLGFSQFAGELEQGWLVMKSGDHVIGLFKGMFERNMLTFNPGWDQDCNTLSEFKDIRVYQADLIEKGIDVGGIIDSSSKGPASFSVTDPDGNPILFDQHV